MAKVTKVAVSYRRTTNLGNFSSVSIEATAEVTLEEGDKYDACLKRATDVAKTEVERATLADLDSISQQRDAIFAALPGGKK